jgi:hypothetical protein
MRFTSPTLPPEVGDIDVSAGTFRAQFRQSVLDFVASYRVPCLNPEQPSALRQEFVFVPHDGRPVTMFATRDEQALRIARLQRCVTQPEPRTLPEYPPQLVLSEVQTTVVLRLAFTGPTAEPAITVLNDGGSVLFPRAVRKHADGYRMPCHDGAGPAEIIMTYVFMVSGAQRLILRDMPLVNLLGSVKGIRSANVFFDFSTMGCPFDLRFRLLQPYAPNEVGEVGPTHPDRAHFLDWLSRQQLELRPSDINALIGQHALVNVPCTVLDLGQRGGSGASQ